MAGGSVERSDTRPAAATERLAERAQAGAGVEDDELLPAAHLDTAGVAAHHRRGCAGAGDAPADSPESNTHGPALRAGAPASRVAKSNPQATSQRPGTQGTPES